MKSKNFTKKNEQIEGKKSAAEGGRIFFWPFFQPKQEKIGFFPGFLPKKQDQIQKNPKKSRFKSKKSKKKAQANRDPDFGHFG